MNSDLQQRLVQLLESERKQLLQYACYRTGVMQDAEDAVQDAVAKILHLKGPIANLRGYFYQTVAHACIDIVRQRQRQQTDGIEIMQLWHREQHDEFSQEFRRINEMLAQIPEEQSEVIRLRFYADKSFADIAEMLDLPLATVKSRFLYGMSKMKKSLTPKIN